MNAKIHNQEQRIRDLEQQSMDKLENRIRELEQKAAVFEFQLTSHDPKLNLKQLEKLITVESELKVQLNLIKTLEQSIAILELIQS